ncbi:MAG: hypothetical protein M1813_006460 [Trichoglossum hirsutum]|nr:MAG: hypothetical protein M1813_006460 [Trichoglossum hirsutum]
MSSSGNQNDVAGQEQQNPTPPPTPPPTQTTTPVRAHRRRGRGRRRGRFGESTRAFRDGVVFEVESQSGCEQIKFNKNNTVFVLRTDKTPPKNG